MIHNRKKSGFSIFLADSRPSTDVYEGFHFTNKQCLECMWYTFASRDQNYNILFFHHKVTVSKVHCH